jgi:hypothetical protein
MQKIKILVLLFLPLTAFTQQTMEVGAMLGFANYQGDLAEDPIEFGETKLAYGVFGRYHISERVKLRVNLLKATITGSDENAVGTLKDRQWRFKTDLIEAGVQGEFHPLGKSRYSNTGIFQKQISPYIATGVGFVLANNKVTTPEADREKFPEKDLTSNFISIPFIAGVRADMVEQVSLGFEWGWRSVINDYLDGVSKNGNPDKNDWYLFIGLNLSFHFGGPASSFQAK